MITLQEIEKYYPENLRAFKKNILREYLQYKILDILFRSPYANKIAFLGGTALRIVHGNSRFSEDLDFDNFGLKETEFDDISHYIQKELVLEGYEVEIRNVYKGAFRCYLRIPRLLFDNKLSGYEEEKILIQLDTVPHNFPYEPEKVLLNKFDVFTEIRVTPIDIILSQKIYAIFNRKTKKGRDFYDVVFLFSKTSPRYEYLEAKAQIPNGTILSEKLLKLIAGLDMVALAKDVEPFLFRAEDADRVRLFGNFIEQKLS